MTSTPPITPTTPPVPIASGNIRVVCRFRPQNSIEDREGGSTIVSIDPSGTSCRVESREYPGQFTFDTIFDWTCRQADIFVASGEPLVEQCFQGFNSTLFCYGQTGSGKTYTMMGSNIDDPDGKGITPRIVERIFAHIAGAPSSLEFTVKVAFMEIYMERIRDLLSPANDNLPIHEDKTRGIHVKGLKEVYVGNADEVFAILKMGDSTRMTSSTNMNEQSSRSHSIFVLTIAEKDIATGSMKEGKMSLVDLAGSEKVGKTGATGQTLEEAKKINKSLTALGMVINSLTDGKSTHVPYRDSKLTRILQESLGGNSMTTLIINCSPSSYNDAETISTLRFGMRAKAIKNKATINVELSTTELKQMLKGVNSQLQACRTYITALEQETRAWRAGEKVPPEQYAVEGAASSITAADSVTTAATGSTVNFPLAATRTDPNTARSSVESVVAASLAAEERDEFLERENQLMDQLIEKEMEADTLQAELDKHIAELAHLREKEGLLGGENKEMAQKIASLQLDVERLTYDSKDSALFVQSLKDSNEALQKQMAALETQLQEALSSVEQHAAREQQRTQKAAQMVQDFAQAEQIEIATPARTSMAEPITATLGHHRSESTNSRLADSQEADWQAIRATMEGKLEQYERVKKSLVKDLQNRCEKVVELEIQLDEADERYQTLSRASNIKSQQKKMVFLERNLDQLSKVQKQLVDQNVALKKNLDVADQKISNRNQRINDLEKLIQELNVNLGVREERHEAELADLRRQLDVYAAKAHSHVSVITPSEGKIVKPLRGGLAGKDELDGSTH